MMPCMFDHFPCEVLHTTFDYLKPADLLYAFAQLNPYIDTVLNSYTRIKLNFKSIKKSVFYFICENVRPHQIQSLILSDDLYAQGQTKLFMSLLPLIQFNNLQYFSLDQMDDIDRFCLIFSHLENHTQLRWLSVTGSYFRLSKKNARYIAGILQTLSSLKRLTFMDSSILLNLRQPLSELTHLTIRSCIPNDLRIIFQWVPNLLHLEITIPFGNHIPVFDYVPVHLISLKIESGNWTSFDEVERLLSQMTSLKSLTLEIIGEQTLLDANRWQILIKTKLPHLKELALNISPEENNMTGDDVLTPFQNSFWTIEKRWSMACLISTNMESCARLFSVPYFAPIEAWYPPSEGFYNYSLTPYSFDKDCTNLRISYIPANVPIASSFQRVHTLSIEGDITNFVQLPTTVNLSSVNHLKLEYPISFTMFNDILQAASNIRQLSANRAPLMNVINLFVNDGHAYEQIKQLHVHDTLLNTDIDTICKIFPKLEHISISIKEQVDVVQTLSKFPYLTSAIVHWAGFSKKLLSKMAEDLQENSMSIDDTYQLSHTSINIWMD